jgi:hypothetical protein
MARVDGGEVHVRAVPFMNFRYGTGGVSPRVSNVAIGQ